MYMHVAAYNICSSLCTFGQRMGLGLSPLRISLWVKEETYALQVASPNQTFSSIIRLFATPTSLICSSYVSTQPFPSVYQKWNVCFWDQLRFLVIVMGSFSNKWLYWVTLLDVLSLELVTLVWLFWRQIHCTTQINGPISHGNNCIYPRSLVKFIKSS